MYWGLTAMDVMGALGDMDKAKIVDFAKSCQKPEGAFTTPFNNHIASH
jgi:prenyltransferase beta subunit